MTHLRGHFDGSLSERSTLIESIQGEWLIECEPLIIRIFAFRVAMLVWLVAFIISVSILITHGLDHQAPDESVVGVAIQTFLRSLVVSVVIAAIAFAAVLQRTRGYQKLDPMVITGSQLVWKKGSGRIPERIDLETLIAIERYTGEGEGEQGLTAWLERQFNPFKSGEFTPYACLVKNSSSNPVRLPLGLFRDGDRLTTVLMKIAQLNASFDATAER